MLLQPAGTSPLWLKSIYIQKLGNNNGEKLNPNLHI